MSVLSETLQGTSFPVGQMYDWNRSIQDLDGNQAFQTFFFAPNSSGHQSATLPQNGTTGTAVTITGSGFDPNPANNPVLYLTD